MEDLTDRLIEQLHQGKLDAVLLALPYDCGNVEIRILFEDRFKVALRRRHPLAAAREISLRQLRAQEILLLREGHCLRDQALAACRLVDRHQSEPVEATSLHTLVQMVDNGLGITLLPELALRAGILRGTHAVARRSRARPPAGRSGWSGAAARSGGRNSIYWPRRWPPPPRDTTGRRGRDRFFRSVILELLIGSMGQGVIASLQDMKGDRPWTATSA